MIVYGLTNITVLIADIAYAIARPYVSVKLQKVSLALTSHK